MASSQARSWIGLPIFDRAGEPIGTIEFVHEDHPPEDPGWAVISNGSGPHVVPLRDAHRADGRVQVPVSAQAVSGSPDLSGKRDLSLGDRRKLRQHYDASMPHESDAVVYDPPPAAAPAAAPV